MPGFVRVAPGVQRLSLAPLDLINVYLVGDVLIDAGARGSVRRLIRTLEDRPPSAHVLTHGHLDHQGGSHAVCKYFGIPLSCGEGDRDAVETSDQTLLFADEHPFIARLADRMGGPAHRVERTLREGDAVADFTVVEAPSHTPGHLAFWRARDRVLILGDVLFNRNPVTLRRSPAEPFRFLAWDPALNRASARKLAALEPEIVCFGHGPPLRDAAAFQAAVAQLPAD